MSENIIEDIKIIYYDYVFILTFIVALLAGGVIIYYINSSMTPKELCDWLTVNKNSVYPAIATISGTLIGFILTGVSIILTFIQFKELSFLKNNKQYKEVYNIYFTTFYCLSITTIIALIGLIYNDGNPDIRKYIFYATIFTSVISAASLYRCVWVLKGIVKVYLKS